MPRRSTTSSDGSRSNSPVGYDPYGRTYYRPYQPQPVAYHQPAPVYMPAGQAVVRTVQPMMHGDPQPYAYRVRRVIPAGVPVAPVLRTVEEEPIIVVDDPPVETTRVHYITVPQPAPQPPPRQPTPPRQNTRLDDELVRRLEQVEKELERERERNAELEAERLALLKRREAERTRDARDDTIDSLRNKLARLAEERGTGPEVDDLRAKINRLEMELQDERRDRDIERREWETKQRHIQDMLEKERDREEAEAQELIHLQRRLLQEKDDEIRFLSQLAAAHKEQIALLHSQLNIEEVDEILGVDHRLLRADVANLSVNDLIRNLPPGQRDPLIQVGRQREQTDAKYKDFVNRAVVKAAARPSAVPVSSEAGYTSASDYDEPASRRRARTPVEPTIGSARAADPYRERDDSGYRSSDSMQRDGTLARPAGRRDDSASSTGYGASSQRLADLRRQLEEAKQEREKVSRLRAR